MVFGSRRAMDGPQESPKGAWGRWVDVRGELGYNPMMGYGGLKVSRGGQASGWLGSLHGISGWDALAGSDCALGVLEAVLPVLGFSHGRQGQIGALSPISLLVVAPMWDFALAAAGEGGLDAVGPSLLQDFFKAQDWLSPAKLCARREGFARACQASLAGSPPRAEAASSAGKAQRAGVEPFLDIARLTRSPADIHRAQPGELVELSPMAGAGIQAMMIGRVVARELSESEFIRAARGAGLACEAIFSGSSRACVSPWSMGSLPKGWLDPEWLRRPWPSQSCGYGPGLAAMRERSAMEDGVAPGAASVGSLRI